MYFWCMKNVTLLIALFLCASVAWAQDQTFSLNVLGYQWTTTHRALTFTWAGHADSTCNGNSNLNGYVSSGGNFTAYGTSYGSCSATYTPPVNQTIDIRKPVMYVLAQTEHRRMVLTCTRNVRWSQCHALNPGEFTARMNRGYLEVEALSNRGKAKWVKFDVLEQFLISSPQPQAVTSNFDEQREHFAQLDGSSAELRGAAAAGVLDAQMYLGYAYEVGKGVPEDSTAALVWFNKALAHPDISVTDRSWIKDQIGTIEGELQNEKSK